MRDVADPAEGEMAIVVAEGAVDLPPSQRLAAFSVLRLGPGVAVEMRALESPTLAIGVRAEGSSLRT